jgi:hypothetical protein
MKKILNLSLFIATALMLFACDENTADNQTEKVQFTFSSAPSENGGRLSNDLPGNVKLYISLTNPSGTTVRNEIINIFAFGGNYLTQPIELPVGRYSISDFFIVSSASEILFATPRQGSTLAAAVNHPLPFGFTLGKGKTATVEMQVIDATKHSPQAFGYAAFNITVVNPLPIGVFIEQGSDLVLTNANGFIYESDSDILLQEFSLSAKIGYVSFIGELDKEYRMVIQKDGYIQYSKLFSYNLLLEELQGEPLEVVLQPIPHSDSFTFRNFLGSGTFTFDLSFEGEGSVAIDWGDGTSEVIGFSPESSSQQIAHGYLSADQFNVVVTGDLDKIIGFQDNLGFIAEMDLAGLPNLKSLTLQVGQMLLLDVSRAYRLESLSLGSMDIIDINIEDNPFLKTLALDQIFALQAEQTIAEFHANVVGYGIRDGGIKTTRIFPELSNASQSLIFDLRDHYNFLWINDIHG